MRGGLTDLVGMFAMAWLLGVVGAGGRVGALELGPDLFEPRFSLIEFKLRIIFCRRREVRARVEDRLTRSTAV